MTKLSLGFLAACTAVSATTALFVSRLTLAGTGADDARHQAALFAHVHELVQEEYVEPTEGNDLLYAALRGMVESLDPYSRFYPPEEERALEEETSGRFVGIGVVIETQSPPLTISYPLEESPAERAGLGIGDRIIEVDGRSTGGLGVDEARDLIRGAVGSSVRLRVVPAEGGPPREVVVRREPMRDATVSLSHLVDPAAGIGYLWISSFSEETPQEFDAAVERLRSEGMTSLVLDLRLNPGGVLDAAVHIVNRFLPDGVVVETKGRTRDSMRTIRAIPSEASFEGIPVVVLQNEGSASASEIVAGAVQDHRIGVVVGTRSWGKGVVQSIKRIGDEGISIRLTTAYYFTPAGRNFERELEGGGGGGIAPDLLVEVSRDEIEGIRNNLERYDVPEKYRAKVEERRRARGLHTEPEPDPQLDAAVALLRGESPAPRLLR
jgi:carboxyl-terminal processing protease